MRLNTLLSIAVSATLSINAIAAGNVSFSGFISNGYLKSSDHNYLANTKDGDFDFAEASINATWSPMERTVVRGQLFAWELGPYGNFKPLVDYLFVDYNASPAFGVRVGRVKRPAGIYTDIQDIDVARSTIMLPMGMYDPRYRDSSASVDGVSLYGNIQLGKNQSIDYTAYAGWIDYKIDSGIAGYAQTQIGSTLTDVRVNFLESDTNAGVQLWWNTSLPGLRIGSSYSLSENIELESVATHPLNGAEVVIQNFPSLTYTQFSVEYYVDEWTFTSEYNTTVTESDNIWFINGNRMPRPGSKARSKAWYVSASKRFLSQFEAGVTYSDYINKESLGNIPNNTQEDLQFSIRYDATEHWTLKAEIHSINGVNRLFNQYGQNPTPVDSTWTLFAIKSTFSF